MNNYTFDIDNDAVKHLTAQLRTMKNKSFPWVVRNTLNDLAKDVKQVTMPVRAKVFTQRTKTFFKSQSAVNFANGNNISTMQSQVGFANWKTKTDAVSNLEQQEHGGTIDDRSFLPTKEARVSSSSARMVRGKNRIRGLVKKGRITDKMASNAGVYNATDTLKANKHQSVTTTTNQQRILIGALNAGKNGFFRTDNSLFYVKDVSETKKFRKYKIKIEKIYRYKKDRKVNIKNATHFMEKASVDTMKKATKIYIAHARYKLKI